MLPILIGLGVTAGCAIWPGEQSIALNEVPPAAIRAALAAVDGFHVSDAAVEREWWRKVYELGGTVDGVRFEVEVTANGKVLEIERGDED